MRPPWDNPRTLNSPWKSGSARMDAQADSAWVSKFSNMDVAEPDPISTHFEIAPV